MKVSEKLMIGSPLSEDKENAAAEFLEDGSSDDYEFDDYDSVAGKRHSWSCLFWFFSKSHYLTLTGALTFTIISGLVVPFMSIVLGHIFDSLAKFGLGTYTRDALLQRITGLIWKLVLLGVTSFLSSAFFYALWQLLAEFQARNARECVLEGLLAKQLKWFDNRKSGVASMLTASQTQINELEIALSQPLGLTLQSIITLTASIGIALYHSWKLTFCILAGLPLAIAVQQFLLSKLPHMIKDQKEHLAEASKSTSRSISNILNVKCLNGQVFELGVFSTALKLAAKSYRLQMYNQALQMGIIQFVSLGMFMQGFWYGGILVIANSGDEDMKKGRGTTPGDVMISTWSCLMAVQHFQMMVPHLYSLERGKFAGACLRSIIQKIRKSQGGDEETSIRLAQFGGKLEFHNVSFAYPSRPSKLALKNLTLSITPQKTTWIVGKSGSGKSTIGNLILKSYSPQAGYISLDGNPMETLDICWLRENITLVQQNSVLFDDTVFQNIALGRGGSEVTIQEATEALIMAGGEDFVIGAENIWHRVVGPKGQNLSQGQKQRVVLARAILRNTPLLILDEAISALDHFSRNKIMNSITEWRKGRTTIIITHDLDQIPPNDMVYFLERGNIAECGLRCQLEEQKGGYLRNFLQTFKHSALHRQLSPAGCDTKHSLTRKLSTIGFASSVDAVSSENQNSITQKKRHKRPAYPPNISSHRRSSSGARVSALPVTPRHRFSFDLWPFLNNTPNEQLSLKDILMTVWPSIGGKHRLNLILGIVAAFVHSAAVPTFSFVLSKLLTLFCSPEPQAEEFKLYAFAVLVVAAVDGAAIYIMQYYLESVSQEWVDNQRYEAFRRVMKQPLEWFESPHSDVNRISENLEKHAEEMKGLLGRFLGSVFVGVTMIGIAVSWALFECVALTIVVMALVLVMLLASALFTKIADGCEECCNSAVLKTGEVLREVIENVCTVKMMQLDGYFKGRYDSAVTAVFNVGLERCAWGGCAFALTESFMLWALALILYYGAYLVAMEKYKLDTIMGVLTLLSFSISNANFIFGMIPQLSSCKDATRRVLRLSQLPLITHESLGTLQPSNIQGNLELKNLNFGYNPGSLVIDQVSISIPAQEPPLLITGPSGSGKSTLLKLLLRLYPTGPGTIKIDSTDIIDIDVRYLRELISFVPASPGLFDGLTVFENIVYGNNRADCSLESVSAAAKLAGIHDFILALPQGYNTALRRGSDGSGFDGCSLSGGQAKRVAIARAIVRKPKVLLLDEPSSALDVESERVLAEGLERLASEEGVTVVIVTHSNVGIIGSKMFGKRVVVSNGQLI